MSPATYAAPEIIAMMTAARPDLMRQMFDYIGYSPSIASDPWDAAVVNSCLLSGAVDESPAGRMASALYRHLRFHGRSEKLAKDSSATVLRALFSIGADTLAAAPKAPADAHTMIVRAMIGKVLATQGADEVVANKIIDQIVKFLPEYDAAVGRWEFGYSTPATSKIGIGLAAAACGGHLVDSAGSNDLAIVDLPFSAFVGTTDAVDPVVLQALNDASAILKMAKNVLFKVDWSVGNRLASSLNGYRRFLSSKFPKLEFGAAVVENSKLVPGLPGAEAFIVGAPAWTRKFKPLEVLVPGLGENDADHNFPAVEAAIRGLMRAI
jgi:hypothetical protein